jgi:hypothetical protein
VRDRKRILASLESTFREAFEKAKERADQEEMIRLDLDFQRDQLRLEVLLDVRDLLLVEPAPVQEEQRSLLKEGSELIEKAGAIRRMTRLL